jgi:hypothetical protein
MVKCNFNREDAKALNSQTIYLACSLASLRLSGDKEQTLNPHSLWELYKL